MGSILYDFLTESMLFDEERIQSRFADIPDAELRRELARYREHCLANLDELRRELADEAQALRVFSGPGRISKDDLARGALYLDTYVLDDPLFALTHEPSEMAQTMVRAIGVKGSELDRGKLCDALQFMRSVTPMVVADYVKFLPVSRIYEPPDEVHVNYSENYFSDVLPKSVLDFFHEHARVRSIARADVGWVVLSKLEPSRGISINFGDYRSDKAWIYHLQEMEVLHTDEATRQVRVALHIPETPPDENYFKAWVYQSINQAARDAHNSLLSEVAMAAGCNAMYLARSDFAFQMLEQLGTHRRGIAEFTAGSILNIDLPALENVDLADLMRVRSVDGEAFKHFRYALERGFRELRLEDDPDKLRIKRDNLVHELTDLRIREIDSQIRSLKKSALADLSVTLAVLGGAFFTSGSAGVATLLATAVAAFRGYKTVEDYRRQVKTNPAFFLWKARRDHK
ncbi:hypothetical protein WME99_00560 [Sorangium sp. So ce136]|uniref:hypothetical protein n=1 Tax=Sorangium sp. So ce136 TaxID=3133284 RepID=UPI003F1125B8